MFVNIKNAEFLGYYFYMTNIKGDFQICISLPLKQLQIKMIYLRNHIFEQFQGKYHFLCSVTYEAFSAA